MAATSVSGQQPVISVCIANYNGIEIINGCLRSVMQQQSRFSFEILVHDDASSDGSADFVRTNYPGVTLIRSETNVGFCIANNRMAEAARGQYLLLLNNDAELHADALQTLLAEAGRLEEPTILTLPQYDAISGQLVDRGCLLDPFFNPVPNLDPMRANVGMVIGACLWIPKTLWLELDGFPEWFGSVAEDMFLCCRARLAGYRVAVLATSGYKHYQGWSFGGNRPDNGRLRSTYRRRALSERNKTYVMIVSAPMPQLVFILPVHLVMIAVEGIAIAFLGRDAKAWNEIYYSAFKATWRARRQLIETRNKIQAARKTGLNNWLGGFVKFPRKLKMLFRYGIPSIN